MTLRGWDWALAGGAVIAAAVCVGLGVWQLDRLGQRRARNAEIRAARALPPLEVRAGVPAESIANRRVAARGVYDYERERLWRARPYQGTPGVHLITPLRLADGSAVLVDRGWVPSPDAARLDRTVLRGPDSASVLGLGVFLPRGLGDVNPHVLADSVPYRLLGFGIELVPAATPAPPGLPIAPPPPALGNGPHLGYAIQWFSFAVIVLIGTGALLRKSGGPRNV